MSAAAQGTTRLQVLNTLLRTLEGQVVTQVSAGALGGSMASYDSLVLSTEAGTLVLTTHCAGPMSWVQAEWAPVAGGG